MGSHIWMFIYTYVVSCILINSIENLYMGIVKELLNRNHHLRKIMEANSLEFP